MDLIEFYKNKKVLITGHTGFKGSWLCLLLKQFGANVIGYSLEPPTEPSMFELCSIKKDINNYFGDIRDFDCLKKVFDEEKPDIVIHMAAQPIVRESYKKPVYTYDVNVMGTVNVLECVRLCESVVSFVNVTTDKVYLNRELNKPFKEDEELCGYDPYSNSKSCSELVTYSYKNSFFGGKTGIMESRRRVAISTCRAGNVIGGGDFANDRIIPDCVRAALKGEQIIVRNPNSIRPYQHVLEPLWAYLTIAALQYNDNSFSDSYNIGPNDDDCVSTGDMVSIFCDKWNIDSSHKKIDWKNMNLGGPHEASFLRLDSSKARTILKWKPVWNVNEAVSRVIEWTDVYSHEGDLLKCSIDQIADFIKLKTH